MNKLTKDYLAKMSDFEVFEKLSGMTGDWISECQRWCDLMPLAVEHGVWLQSIDSGDDARWTAGANTYFSVTDKSPQRAIACCLILVLQERET